MEEFAGNSMRLPGGGQEAQQQQEEQRRAIEEQRRIMLKAILSPDAQQRINRIHFVKPEKAIAAENFILRGVQTGALQGPVSDATLIQILDKISGATAVESAPKVTMRRRNMDDDDDF